MATREQSTYTDTGCRRLASAVLLLAVKDLRHPTRTKKAAAFFGPKGGTWFKVLSEVVELQPDTIRQKVASGELRSLGFKLPYK